MQFIQRNYATHLSALQQDIVVLSQKTPQHVVVCPFKAVLADTKLFQKTLSEFEIALGFG